MGVNSLPETVTRQRRDCDLNLGPFAPESSTLTTRLSSHPFTAEYDNNNWLSKVIFFSITLDELMRVNCFPLGEWSIMMSVSVCLCLSCLCICLRADLRNCVSDLRRIVCACYLRPWLDPPLTASLYVIYSRFCKWRHNGPHGRMPTLLQRVTSLRRRAQASAPAASYWLRRFLDDGGPRLGRARDGCRRGRSVPEASERPGRRKRSPPQCWNHWGESIFSPPQYFPTFLHAVP